MHTNMKKEDIIPFKDLTDDQMEYITSTLYRLPYSIRMTYEILPGATYYSPRSSDTEVYPYDKKQTVDEYMNEHGDQFDFSSGDNAVEWNKRLIVNVYGANPENIEDRGWTMYDLQSMWPIGADTWSERAESLYQCCIAPLTVLVPAAWELYGVEIDTKDIRVWKHQPAGISGKGKSVLERIWKELGGDVTSLEADEYAASICVLDHWTLENYEFWEEVIQEFMKYAKEKLGEEKFNKLRGIANKNNMNLFTKEEEEEETEEEEEGGNKDEETEQE